MNAPHVEDIDLDSLPPGLHRQWLSIVHDGLGRQVRLPLLIAKGVEPGPVCGITAAVHGNEINGISVIQKLLHTIDTNRLRGVVLGVPVVNIGGFLLRQRRTDDGLDLNHLFPGKAHGREGDVLAWRFTEKVLKRCDLLLDLHTASFGRVNCLYVRADMTHPETARIAYLQRPHIIVHNPAADGTLRGAAAALGIPAVTVEIGNAHRFQKEYTKRSRTGIRAVLSAWNMLPKRNINLGEPPVLCSRSAWMYTDHGGLLQVLPKVTERVGRGEPVAHLRSIFGDLSREYAAPEDGIVIGHSVDPVADTGARILHLGVVAHEFDPLILRED